MLFGDSYRRWFDQLAEYCHHYKHPRPRVVKTKAKWIGFGGLKWCSESHLQEALDEEGDGRKAAEFSDWKPLSEIERRTLEKRVRFSPSQNVKVMAHPLAGANVDRGVEVENTWEHG
jgi:hypothetical protein